MTNAQVDSKAYVIYLRLKPSIRKRQNQNCTPNIILFSCIASLVSVAGRKKCYAWFVAFDVLVYERVTVGSICFKIKLRRTI